MLKRGFTPCALQTGQNVLLSQEVFRGVSISGRTAPCWTEWKPGAAPPAHSPLTWARVRIILFFYFSVLSLKDAGAVRGA